MSANAGAPVANINDLWVASQRCHGRKLSPPGSRRRRGDNAASLLKLKGFTAGAGRLTMAGQDGRPGYADHEMSYRSPSCEPILLFHEGACKDQRSEFRNLLQAQGLSPSHWFDAAGVFCHGQNMYSDRILPMSTVSRLITLHRTC